LAKAEEERQALEQPETGLQPPVKENIDAVDALLGTGTAEEAVKIKPKRKIHKLTDEMLMGKDGFTKLIKQAKGFKKRSNPVRDQTHVG
jgi:hypothetical protein